MSNIVSTYPGRAQGMTLNWGHPCVSRLALCLLFNEKTNSVFDYAQGPGNIATLTGTPAYLEDRFNANSTGTTGLQITSPPILNNWTQQTVEMLFKVTASMVQFACVIEKGQNSEWRISWNNTANDYRIHIQDLGGTGSRQVSIEAFNDNRWHHLVCTLDSVANIVGMYVDGHYEGSTSSPNTIGAKTGNIYIANSPWAGSFHMNAGIELVRIYNTILTPTEVLDLYVNPYGMFQSQYHQPKFTATGSVPPGSSIRFRKTFSALGTKAGIRQLNAT